MLQIKPMKKGRKLIFTTRNNPPGLMKSRGATDTMSNFLEEYGVGDRKLR
jgi:hypothetical protein